MRMTEVRVNRPDRDFHPTSNGDPCNRLHHCSLDKYIRIREKTNPVPKIELKTD
uniref:Uncharacterized protein n=1 Tax=Arion vulgaris TaxID=1028688 RepID=A0A0B7A8N9_9EUPU